MMHDLTIRPATDDDIAAISQLIDANFPAGETGHWSADDMRAALGEETRHLAVAYADGDLVGFLFWQGLLDEVEILLIIADAAQRQKGVAQALWSGARDDWQQQDMRSVFLEVRADNHPALGFYQKNGFKAVDRRPNYYQRASGERVDAVVMRVDL